jgi:anti-sigma regulatory factor (Ser/Thr protein kinase)
VALTAARVLPVAEASQAADARRTAVALARDLGFDETETGKVALVVTEAGSNLLKYGRGGEVIVRALDEPPGAGIEILALDRGPGMADMDRSLRDGHSTAGSPGNGLGAIRRLSGLFDLYSAPGAGTAVLARLWPEGPGSRRPAPGLAVGAVSAPHRDETACGDAWVARVAVAVARLLVVDGLGHGPHAAEAAETAVKAFEATPALEPGPMLAAIHEALRSTRGAAVAVAALDVEGRTVRFAGVGNITGTMLDGGGRVRNFVSHNGIVGHQARRVQEFAYPWDPAALVVLHSDGLSSHWTLDPYPGLVQHHPAVVAGVLYRDFNRGRDDVTVVVARGH